MDGTALVLCGGYYGEVCGKTAHGLVPSAALPGEAIMTSVEEH
jgi:hypothetical protein